MQSSHPDNTQLSIGELNVQQVPSQSLLSENRDRQYTICLDSGGKPKTDWLWDLRACGDRRARAVA